MKVESLLQCEENREIARPYADIEVRHFGIFA